MGERVQVTSAGHTEHARQLVFVELGHLAHRGDSPSVELGRRDPADAPQTLDWQRMQKGQFALRLDDQEAIRLGHAAGHLGQELGPGHPDRDREPHLLADLAAQPERDLDRSSADVTQAADIQKGLVNR